MGIKFDKRGNTMDIRARDTDRELLLEFSGEMDHHGARNALKEVEIAMKGELDNIRAWGTYLSTIKYNCDVIMGATFKVEDNEKTGGYTVTVVGYPGIFVNWHPATQDDYEWIRLQKLSPTDGKSQIAPVVKNKN
jgi:hypothetical protein